MAELNVEPRASNGSRFDWQNATSEIKQDRTHTTKDFKNPFGKGRVKILSAGLLHAFTDKGFEDIEKELPDFNFPEGIELKTKADSHFIMDLPSWGIAKVEDGVVRVYDKKGVSIFRYHSPVVIEKGKPAYKVVDIDGTKIRDASSHNEEVSIDERVVVGDAVDACTFEVSGNKLYLKPPTTLKNKYPLQAYDATDVTATNNIDSYMYEAAATTNYGTSYLILRHYTGGRRRLVMDWTLPSDPGSISISQISLYLRCYYLSPSSLAVAVNCHELTQASAMVENQVTWNIWKTGSSWASAGGDYSATVVDASNTPGAVPNWQSWNLYGTGSDNPMSITWGSNFDLLLKFATEDTTGDNNANYYMKEYGTANLRPYIQITYIPVYQVSVTDGFKGGDTCASQCSFQVSLTDGLKGADTTTNIASLQNALTDGVKFGDTAIIFRALYESLSDGVKLSDAVSHAFQTNPSLTDGLKLSDTITSLLVAYNILTDGVKLGDTPSMYLSIYKALTDGIKLSDTASVRLDIYPSLTDGVKFGDTLSYLLAAVIKEILLYLLIKDGLDLDIEFQDAIDMSLTFKNSLDTKLEFQGGGDEAV